MFATFHKFMGFNSIIQFKSFIYNRFYSFFSNKGQQKFLTCFAILLFSAIVLGLKVDPVIKFFSLKLEINLIELHFLIKSYTNKLFPLSLKSFKFFEK